MVISPLFLIFPALSSFFFLVPVPSDYNQDSVFPSSFQLPSLSGGGLFHCANFVSVPNGWSFAVFFLSFPEMSFTWLYVALGMDVLCFCQCLAHGFSFSIFAYA